MNFFVAQLFVCQLPCWSTSASFTTAFALLTTCGKIVRKRFSTSSFCSCKNPDSKHLWEGTCTPALSHQEGFFWLVGSSIPIQQNWWKRWFCHNMPCRSQDSKCARTAKRRRAFLCCQAGVSTALFRWIGRKENSYHCHLLTKLTLPGLHNFPGSYWWQWNWVFSHRVFGTWWRRTIGVEQKCFGQDMLKSWTWSSPKFQEQFELINTYVKQQWSQGSFPIWLKEDKLMPVAATWSEMFRFS